MKSKWTLMRNYPLFPSTFSPLPVVIQSPSFHQPMKTYPLQFLQECHSVCQLARLQKVYVFKKKKERKKFSLSKDFFVNNSAEIAESIHTAMLFVTKFQTFFYGFFDSQSSLKPQLNVDLSLVFSTVKKRSRNIKKTSFIIEMSF